MKALLENDYFNWTLRTIVGLVLVVAAIDKAAIPSAFAVSIANYKLIGDGPALWVATILPWIELVIGLSVLFGVLRSGGAVVASGLFAIFTALMASALARGLDISCGCFSQDPGVGTINGLRMLENVGLLIASILIARSDNGSFSVRRVRHSTSVTQRNRLATCVERVNPKRVANGLAPIVPLPGAYEAEEVA